MNKLLSEILLDIYRGVYQIPSVDKHLQWTPAQRLDLLQSINEGIPIGGVTVMLTGMKIEVRDDITPTPLKDPLRPLHEYVLDGHNRLHTLYSVFGKGAVAARRGRDAEPIVGAPSDICFDCKTGMFTDDSSSCGKLIPVDDFLNPHIMVKYLHVSDTFSLEENSKLGNAIHSVQECVVHVVQFATNDRGKAQTAFSSMNRGVGSLTFI